MDELRKLHHRLGSLLDNPQEGLFTWREDLHDTLMAMANYAGEGNVVEKLKQYERLVRIARTL